MAEVVILVLVAYVFMLFGISRRAAAAVPHAERVPFFVFAIPCLNEEVVIGQTIESLLALEGENYALLVVDDASDDRTAEIVRAFESDRVWLLERTLPDARAGKGAALNAAYRWLLDSDALAGRSPEDVVVGVFDADGRLDPAALEVVARHFADARTGAVQIAVSMRNVGQNLLTRLQDFEFAVFTEIFQRARQRIGSVGLGGNGQFVRLSALESLGPRPWSDCLTEDLDLGARLLIGGWTNRFCGEVAVSQQAVTTLGRWIRQRSRWFLGHLQCWRLVPAILRSRVSARVASDLLWYLLLPAAVLVTPVAIVPLLISVIALAIAAPHVLLDLLAAGYGAYAFLLYFLMFGPAYLYAYAYWRIGRARWGKSLVLGHVFELYAYLWFVAGWIAVFRGLLGMRGWTKTSRVKETPAEAGVAV